VFPDPARLTLIQIIVSVVAVGGASLVAALLVLRRGVPRRTGAYVLCAFALLALYSWLRFGQLHVIAVRPPGSPFDAARTEQHRPLQFHEFFHYYLGSKYFAELGYLGLYDCTALADREIAAQDGAPPRVTGVVRNLGDVLTVETVADARSACAAGPRSRFSEARWNAFEGDVRTLQHLVPDGWWNDVVGDKGLNPPPTSILLGSALANLVPIEAAGIPTWLVVTSIDAVLVVLAYVGLRRAFGASAAALGAVTFGASFIASYGWLGGAVLRFTWVAAVALSLVCMRRGRWVLAGALAGWAVCDRVFPAGIAIGASIPLALGSTQDRRRLARFAASLGAVVIALGSASLLVFGEGDWRVFVARTIRDSSVHNVLHIGLDKILTYRPWVPAQDFSGPEGMLRFRLWNERIDATWASERPLALVAQLAFVLAAVIASRKRASFEAAVLVGVTAMFCLASPASYYYVILAVVPVVLFRAALVAHGPDRARELVALLVFQAFWLVTLFAPVVLLDPIVADLAICAALAIFLSAWIVAWSWRRS
jgi:hypothetical protein